MIVYDIAHKYTRVYFLRSTLIQLKNTYRKKPNFNFTLRRPYSTSSSPKEDNPIPVLIITNLQDKDSIFSKRDLPFFFNKKKIELEVYTVF
jgi:hypothetical protein